MKNKQTGWCLLQLLMVFMMTVMAGSAFAAGEALLHNSQTTGSTKWGGNWGVSGGQYGAFTCSTCHTTTTNNIKRIVGSIPTNIGPSGVKPVTFNNMTGFGDETAHTTSAKICEVCHTATTTHQYNTSNAPQSGATTHYGLDCTTCHQHSDGFKKSSHAVPLYATSAGHASCGSTGIGCHLNSNPAAAYPAVPSGSAPDCRSCHAKGDPTVSSNGCGSCHGAANGTGEPSGTVYPDVAGSHSLHTALAPQCSSCHDVGGTGGNADHGKGNRGTNPAVVNLAASLTWNSSTCASASCHPNPYGTGSATTPVWGTTGNGCNACHSVKPIGVNGPVTGSHGGLHTGIACTACHAAGTTATTVPSTGHKDGNITIANVNYPATVAPHVAGSGYSNCSNFYCHSYGTTSIAPFKAKSAPVWGGTVNCYSCHGSDSTTGLLNNMSTGRHKKHMVGTYSYGCAVCHAATVSNNTTISDATKHVNQKINVSFSGVAKTGGANVFYSISTHAPGATVTVNDSCSNVYCHSNAQTGGQVGTTYYFRNLTGSKRFNQTTAVSLGCNGCHSTGSTITGKWTLSGAHLSHVSLPVNPQIGKALACGDCHANGGSSLNKINHANGLINYSAALSGSIARGNLKLSTGRCNTVYCHSNGRGAFNNMSANNWFSGVNLGCNGCHADKAGAAGLNPLSGKHDAHLNYAATGGNYGCVACHASTVSNDTTLTASGNHVNAYKNFSGAKAYKTGFAPGSGTCSTYCHTDGRGAAVAPPLWTSLSTLDCSGCHAKDAIATGSHQEHLTGHITNASCANCHNSTTNDNTTITGAAHTDGSVTMLQGGTYVGNKNVEFAYAGNGTCNNISCHSTATAGPYSNTANWWNPSSVTCETCHPKTGLSGAHKIHMGALDLSNGTVYYNMTANRTPASPQVSETDRSYGFGCGECHPMEAANHLNGSIDVDLNRVGVAGVSSLRFLNHSTATYDKNGTKKCSNVYCHSNASRVEAESNVKANTSLAWNDTFAAHSDLDRCAMCHDNQPWTGAHAAHSVGNHYSTDFTAANRASLGSNKLLTAGVNTFWSIYNGISGKVATKAVGNTGHGDSRTSTTISCYICHFETVRVAANDNNYRCAGCHLNGTNGAVQKGKAAIYNLALHVNGQRDVHFNPIKVISKAQIRPESFKFYSGVWVRNNGNYKNYTTQAFDTAKLALDTSTMWHPGAPMASNCSNIACHNGHSVNWNLANFNDPNKCMDCHNKL